MARQQGGFLRGRRGIRAHRFWESLKGNTNLPRIMRRVCFVCNREIREMREKTGREGVTTEDRESTEIGEKEDGEIRE